MTTEAMKRARLALASHALRFLRAADSPLTRKELFVPVSREQDGECAKKPWQQAFLDECIKHKYIEKVDEDNRIAYVMLSDISLASLLQDYDTGGTNIARLLWPSDLSIANLTSLPVADLSAAVEEAPVPTAEETEEEEDEEAKEPAAEPTVRLKIPLSARRMHPDDETEEAIARTSTLIMDTLVSQIKILHVLGENITYLRELTADTHKRQESVITAVGGLRKRLEDLEKTSSEQRAVVARFLQTPKETDGDKNWDTLQRELDVLRTEVSALRTGTEALVGEMRSIQEDKTTTLVKRVGEASNELSMLHELLLDAVSEKSHGTNAGRTDREVQAPAQLPDRKGEG